MRKGSAVLLGLLLVVQSVILKGRLPQQLALKNVSGPLPMNRFRESSLAQLGGAAVPLLQRSYVADNTTVLIPVELTSTLLTACYGNSFGVLFGRRVQSDQITQLHVEGVCEFEYPANINDLESLISDSIPSLSRIVSLEPIGCIFPNQTAEVSAKDLTIGLLLSRTSRHPNEFVLLR
jgi:hypothetical protein